MPQSNNNILVFVRTGVKDNTVLQLIILFGSDVMCGSENVLS